MRKRRNEGACRWAADKKARRLSRQRVEEREVFWNLGEIRLAEATRPLGALKGRKIAEFFQDKTPRSFAPTYNDSFVKNYIKSTFLRNRIVKMTILL